MLDGVSLNLADGDSLAILRRDGVGKTTQILTLMRMTRLSRGRVLWRGADVTAVPPHRRASLGLGWVPRERMVLPSLTVEEQLTVIARPGHWTVPRIFEMFPRSGLSLILVEQHASIALGLTQNALILDREWAFHRAASDTLLEDNATLGQYVSIASHLPDRGQAASKCVPS